MDKSANCHGMARFSCKQLYIIFALVCIVFSLTSSSPHAILIMVMNQYALINDRHAGMLQKHYGVVLVDYRL